MEFVQKFLNRGEKRTVKAKKNIATSLVLKGISVLSGLLMVPLALEYLDVERYGVWLTLVSFVSWFGFFDVGLGHGLRNKLTKALALSEMERAKQLVSTSYLVLGGISGLILVLLVFALPLVSWTSFFNTTVVAPKELMLVVAVVMSMFAIKLTVELIYSICFALQLPALNDLVETISKVLTLGIIYALTYTSSASLFLFGVFFSAIPVVLTFAFSIYLYFGKFKYLAPSPSHIRLEMVSELFGLGSKFFIVQIASVMLFATDSMIITQLFSPSEVAPYHVSNRYFGIVIIGFSIMVKPFWSATTEALVNEEFQWIRKSVSGLVKLWVLFSVASVVMFLVSDSVYSYWLGDRLSIPVSLSLAWMIFVILQMFNTIFVTFLNGSGKIGLQMITGIFAIFFNIPLSILFAKYLGFGVVGVLVATMISQILSIILRLVQYNKLINRTAKGIWNR